MAHSTTSVLLHKVRRKIGKQIVVKQYGNKTVITAYTGMSNVKPSKLQKQKRKSLLQLSSMPVRLSMTR